MRDGEIEVSCETLTEGPPGIETQEHVEIVVQPIVRYMRSQPANGYVIACFSDPGLLLPARTSKRRWSESQNPASLPRSGSGRNSVSPPFLKNPSQDTSGATGQWG